MTTYTDIPVAADTMTTVSARSTVYARPGTTGSIVPL